MSEQTKEGMTAGDRIRSNPLVSTLLAIGAIVSVVLGFFQLRAWIWPDDESDLARFAAAEVGQVVTLGQYRSDHGLDVGDKPLGMGPEPGSVAHPASGTTWVITLAADRAAVAPVVLTQATQTHTASASSEDDTSEQEVLLPPGFLDLVWSQASLQPYLSLRDSLEGPPAESDSSKLGSTAEPYVLTSPLESGSVDLYDNGVLRSAEEVADDYAGQLGTIVPQPLIRPIRVPFVIEAAQLVVRERPTVESSQVGTVTPVDQLEVTCITGGSLVTPAGRPPTSEWYRIEAPTQGYVSAAYVTRDPDERAPSACDGGGATSPSPSGSFTISDIGALNVRSGPSPEADGRGLLSGGTALSVVCVSTGAAVTSTGGSSTTDWFRIDAPQSGYVSAAFVDMSPDATQPARCDTATPTDNDNATVAEDVWGREVTVKVELEGLRGQQVYLTWQMVGVEDALYRVGQIILEPTAGRDQSVHTLWFPLLVNHPSYQVKVWLQDGRDSTAAPYDETRIEISEAGEG